MRALVVEDNAIRRDELAALLTSMGAAIQVTACSSAEEALRTMPADGYDVAFVDVSLPGMNGVALAWHLQQEFPQINLVFCTSSTEFRGDALDLHCSGYILKPTTREQVRSELRHLRHPVAGWNTDDERSDNQVSGGAATRAWGLSAANNPEGALFMRCFGNFEAFHCGKPLSFGLNKAKELLAYLVCQRGAMSTVGEIEAVLWEDLPYVSSHQSYLRHLVADLSKTLGAVGCPNTLVRKRGALAIDPSTFACDYYDFLDGKRDGVPGAGLFMAQYSWAERIQAALGLG